MAADSRAPLFQDSQNLKEHRIRRAREQDIRMNPLLPAWSPPPWNCSRESSEDHRAAWRERRLGVLGARGASGIAYEARMRDGFYAGRSVLKEHGARGAHPGVHFASGFSRRASNAWNQSCPIGEWHGKYRISTLSRDSSQGYDSARCHRSFPARRGGNRKGRRRCH
jgi:hypothetical protein